MRDKVPSLETVSSPPARKTFTSLKPLIRGGSMLAIQDIHATHRDFLTAATSENTRRAYRSAIRHFLAWGGDLPADEGGIIRYLMAHAASHNTRTQALRLTALSQWHTHQGFPDPASTVTVRKTLKGIGRTYGRPKKQAKALPLEDLERIVATLAALDTIKAKRDNALLQLGFFGGYRRSELANLQIADISWESDGLLITLQRSNTDQQGQGVLKAIPYGTALCCPATALRAWLDAADLRNGAAFRPINKWQMVGEHAIHPASINTILADCAVMAGLDYVPDLSSHSLRRGMATSAYRAGADFRDIKRQGGWRHDGTVQGYIEEAGRFEENAARHLLRKSGS